MAQARMRSKRYRSILQSVDSQRSCSFALHTFSQRSTSRKAFPRTIPKNSFRRCSPSTQRQEKLPFNSVYHSAIPPPIRGACAGSAVVKARLMRAINVHVCGREPFAGIQQVSRMRSRFMKMVLKGVTSNPMCGRAICSTKMAAQEQLERTSTHSRLQRRDADGRLFRSVATLLLQFQDGRSPEATNATQLPVQCGKRPRARRRRRRGVRPNTHDIVRLAEREHHRAGCASRVHA